ncbi:MAG TPA: histidine kinase [Actinocrinis sp.]
MDIEPLESPAPAGPHQTSSPRAANLVWKGLGVALMLAAVNIGVTAHSRPAPGVHGTGLAISLTLAGALLGAAGALATMRAALVPHVAALALLSLSTGALIWFQPRGGSGLALSGVVFMLLSARFWRHHALLPALVLTLFAGLSLEMSAARRESAALGLAMCAPLLSACVLTVLLQSLREAKVRAESLLAQVEANRGAEARAAALAERQHLAREMHDVLAHSLSGLILQLEGVRLLAGTSPSDPRLAQAADRAHELARDGLVEARQAIRMLRDEELPGPDALSTLTDQFMERTGLPCTFTASGQPFGVKPDARLALYRVAQEALTNIVKHADAERVEVRLDYADERVSLTIEDFADDRRAPEPAAESGADDDVAHSGPDSSPDSSSGYGLTGMRERAELLGGTLRTAATRSGFRVELRVPA